MKTQNTYHRVTTLSLFKRISNVFNGLVFGAALPQKPNPLFPLHKAEKRYLKLTFDLPKHYQSVTER